MAKLKTKEEIFSQFENDLLYLEAMIINVDGFEGNLSFHRNMDKLPQELYFKLPEYCTYNLTILYRPKLRDLKKLKYFHSVKKHGLPLSSRSDLMSELAPVGKLQKITFPPETIPGGSLLRGCYLAESKFRENDKTIMKCSWTIEMIKKGEQPGIGGYPVELKGNSSEK